MRQVMLQILIEFQLLLLNFQHHFLKHPQYGRRSHYLHLNLFHLHQMIHLRQLMLNQPQFVQCHLLHVEFYL